MPSYQAPAKVNLRLAVLAREASGYHQIETLFCALDLADEIDIEVGGTDVQLEVQTGQDIGPARANLVARAADAFRHAAGTDAGARIVLRKRIPAGAGLGGGSSDAATTLLALNELHGHTLEPAALLALGAALGSDIPFFLAGAPLAWAWGRGDRLLPLPALPRRTVLVVAPATPVSTAEAYEALALRREESGARPPPAVLDPASFRDWDAVGQIAANEFEDVVFARMPELARIRDAMYAAGAAPALLAGSGSALFGVFRHPADARAARRTIEALADGAAVIETATAGP
jgi:4-diphosphocytidyl-2-C-methyl-D-erythritol kinase